MYVCGLECIISGKLGKSNEIIFFDSHLGTPLKPLKGENHKKCKFDILNRKKYHFSSSVLPLMSHPIACLHVFVVFVRSHQKIQTFIMSIFERTMQVCTNLESVCLCVFKRGNCQTVLQLLDIDFDITPSKWGLLIFFLLVNDGFDDSSKHSKWVCGDLIFEAFN